VKPAQERNGTMNKNRPRRLHPFARTLAAEHRHGLLGRREFLSRATALGLSAPAALGLIGAPGPARAAGHVRQGGTLRIQQEVRPLKDTRTYDWSPIANLTRGTLEYLIEYNNDGSFRGMLLSGWEVSDDATRIVLNLRPGITWSNGDPFTAADVVRNIERWCDRSVPGNSMAGRMATLIDEGTGKLIDGAAEVTDDLTVTLRLRRPDITLIPGMADYPAAIVHESYDPEETQTAIGTGPFRIAEHLPGERAVLERDTSRPWWGTEIYGGPFLDRIEFIDYSTDPLNWLRAFEAGEIDMNYESVGEFIGIMDDIGLRKSEILTAATIVIRPNQLAEINGRRPYADRTVRRALQLAVDNDVILELGYGGRGAVAENHHVAPVHPEYAELPRLVPDPARAREMMAEAGLAAFEHELVSIDDDWRRTTTDAVAAQLRDAGIPVKRTVLPAASYLPKWDQWAFSSTNWNHRPLGVQVLALAYRSGEPWNETGFSNAAFDETLNDALGIGDADQRRASMRTLQGILQEEGVIIQPYWRSLFRHHVEGVVGADMHVAFEIHPYKLAFTDDA